MARKRAVEPPHEKARREAWEYLGTHPLFSPMVNPWAARPGISRGFAIVRESGVIEFNRDARATAGEWKWVFSHLLLHLGFGHFPVERNAVAWAAACDVVVEGFLRSLNLGRPPRERNPDLSEFPRSEQALYSRFLIEGVPEDLFDLGVGPPGEPDLKPAQGWVEHRTKWTDLFARGLVDAVERAVDVAAGASEALILKSPSECVRTPAERARRWLMTEFPLLGSLATTFRLVEKHDVCRRLEVTVAAVDEVMQEIYINPAALGSDEEARFVVAHELLHVGLRHHTRRQGREPYLWNVACDYVINQWLSEMKLGRPPAIGVLLDPELRNLSAESVYDRIAMDLRRLRKLATLRGTGLGDMLDGAMPRPGDPTDLDAFYRGCLANGLTEHRTLGRGILPGGLVEEIWAIAQPPIRWDVALARLFDEWFPALESRRSWARPSRRQSATPDIPRPRIAIPEELRDARTFGVVLDTSGSMMRPLLSRAFGAISSYATARDVAAVRFLQCDAAPHDEGYIAPDALSGRVSVRGRGGTVLQPAIDLLVRDQGFPKDGPILVITDGACDVINIPRPHAFLLPPGGRLPFAPKGPVFYVD